MENTAKLERIFKPYDIRGVYPEEIDEQAVRSIGYGFSRFVGTPGGRELVVGHDARIGSESLAEAFSQGVRTCGWDVIDIGMVTTPMLYFAVNVLGAAGGAMVTASHNPSRYNGLKLVRHAAITLGQGMGLEEVLARASDAQPPPSRTQGALRRESILARYIDFFRERFRGRLGTRLVVDPGNGAGGPMLQEVLSELSIEFVPLYFEPDGRFPNHEANPLHDENTHAIKREVAQHPGAVGVLFDGDGDRVAFVDEQCRSVPGDLATALLATDALERCGSSPVLYDLRSSHSVPEAIREAGGEPVRMRVGHVFMKEAMRAHDALLGGELSCHFYFREFFHCESGVLALLLMLQRLECREETLADAIEPFRRYVDSGEINFEVRDLEGCEASLRQRFKDGRQDTLDGLTVQYDDWWFNIRASNTEPLLRLNLEASSKTLLQEKLALVENTLAEHGCARVQRASDHLAAV